MKERSILFSGEMVKEILEGRKTMTRRVVKCHSIYSLTDDRVCGILTENTKEDTNERHNIIGWNPIESNTSIAERGLYGGFGREDILTDAIQGIWAQGIRGLVSVTRTRQREGLSGNFSFTREQEDNKERSQIGLPCLSRIAETSIRSSKTSRQKPTEQCTVEPSMGDARRELDGQESTWTRKRGGEAPHVEVDRRGTGTYPVDNRKRNLQPAACSKGAWNVAGFNIRHSPYQTGLKLWVRETFKLVPETAYRLSEGVWQTINPSDPHEAAIYKCGWERSPGSGHWRPSIFMPRWASRITLEITGIRVERLQDITEEDAEKEGMPDEYPIAPVYCPACRGEGNIGSCNPVSLGYIEIDCPYCDTAKKKFKNLWDSINGRGRKPGRAWDDNPWVWVVEFRRVENV